jgi:DNA-binding response OmpR family regulator
MPGIEGKSFIERLAEKSSAPILLISGEITEELEKVSGMPGIVEVVRKPLDIERFLSTVEMVTGA